MSAMLHVTGRTLDDGDHDTNSSNNVNHSDSSNSSSRRRSSSTNNHSHTDKLQLASSNSPVATGIIMIAMAIYIMI